MAFGDAYIERVEKIWSFMEPPIDSFSGHQGLYEVFCRQYAKARMLSQENTAFVRQEIVPLLEKDVVLEKEETEKLRELGHKLVKLDKKELLDRMLCLKIFQKLLENARRIGARQEAFESISQIIQMEYHMSEVLKRGGTQAAYDKAEIYNRDARELCREIKEWLPIEKFRELNEKERNFVFSSARIEFLFYQGLNLTAEEVHKRISLCRESVAIAQDPRYRELGGVDWEFGEGICRYYLCVCSEYLDEELELDPEDVEAVYQACLSYMEWIREGKRAIVPISHIEQYRDSVDYLRGHIDAGVFLKQMAADYALRNPDLYDAPGIDQNLLRAAKMLDLLIPTLDQNPAFVPQMESLYKDILEYTLRMPNNGCQELFLNYALSVMVNYTETENGIPFSEMSETFMAACSPSTYVHSQMVGRLGQMLAEEMIDKKPELLIGVCGCGTVQQVRIRRNQIVNEVYRNGVYHDIGKLPYMDTINIVYRRFFDEEMDIVRMHSAAGYEMLKKYPSTEKYAESALGHHCWYDGSGGYPQSCRREDLKHPIIVDLVTAADCMDAATDTLFRGYNIGITLERYIQEVQEGAGTRYNPDIAQLLTDPALKKRLQKLLSEGREEAYQCAYKIYSQQAPAIGVVKTESVPSKYISSEQEVENVFEALFSRLENASGEEHTAVCEEIRLTIRDNIFRKKVRNEYAERFIRHTRANGNPLEKAMGYIAEFWKESNNVAAAAAINAKGMEVIRDWPGYRSSLVYMSLLNNAIWSNHILKHFDEAYRLAAEGLQILNENMVDVQFYYVLMQDIASIFMDVGLYERSQQLLEEVLRAEDKITLQMHTSVSYCYGKVLTMQGKYEDAYRVYLNILSLAQRDEVIDAWAVNARLEMLAYYMKNGVAIHYWFGEMKKNWPKTDFDSSADDLCTYAAALYYSWNRQYENADHFFTKLLPMLDYSELEIDSVLREAAAFYDSYEKYEKAYPLYVKLDQNHQNYLPFIEEITRIENQNSQIQAAQKVYAELFARLKTASRLSQSLVSCIEYEEITELLTARLPEFLTMDDFVLLIKDDNGGYLKYSEVNEQPEAVFWEELALPQELRGINDPKVCTGADAACRIFGSRKQGTLLFIPLRMDCMDYGMLLVYSEEKYSSEEEVLGLAETLGTGLAASIRNIKRYNYAVAKANRDPLTGIFNRGGFEGEYMKLLQTEAESFGLYMLDIDDFKAINDTYGHDIGDQVLLRLSEILSQLRGDALISRYGGEEFVLLVPLHKGDDLKAMGERICAHSRVKHYFSQQEKPITVSVGACRWMEGEPLEAQIKRADIMLYQAKGKGKDCVCCWAGEVER